MGSQPIYEYLSKPDIVSILYQEGIEPRQKGRYLWALCPLPGHIERTPSFKVDPSRQSFHCFGCYRKGDVITLVMKLHDLTFKEALNHLGLSGNSIKPREHKKNRMQDLVKAFREWERAYYDDLCHDFRLYNKFMASLETIEQVLLCADIYHELQLIEYRLDVLQYGPDQEKYGLYQEVSKHDRL